MHTGSWFSQILLESVDMARLDAEVLVCLPAHTAQTDLGLLAYVLNGTLFTLLSVPAHTLTARPAVRGSAKLLI